MKRLLACLAALTVGLAASGAQADSPNAPNPAAPAKPALTSGMITDFTDPLGDLVQQALRTAAPMMDFFKLKATLYHSGGGIRGFDSLGCKVVPMRTAAVDGVAVPRHTVLFIKETVGMPMPDGSKHDGYWYASDVGGAIHQGRIDLFTGSGAHSMQPLLPLNLATLTVAKVGKFVGCPK
ncbi:3D domain-containing protein [Caulobacter sp. KR2-114]|uniref:3D domain-containing protein n=1 Tax=Caulobacter sp. KR2-114 TaxID=3400912 RepID=UPI003BFBBE93